jgi:hypothetical protein
MGVRSTIYSDPLDRLGTPCVWCIVACEVHHVITTYCSLPCCVLDVAQMIPVFFVLSMVQPQTFLPPEVRRRVDCSYVFSMPLPMKE